MARFLIRLVGQENDFRKSKVFSGEFKNSYLESIDIKNMEIKKIMNVKLNRYVLATVASFLMIGNATATVFSTSAVVNSVTNTATFDSITTNGINLNGYTEDGIVVSVNDQSYVGFDFFNSGSGSTALHYGSGGNSSWVTISMVGGSVIKALDFLIAQLFLWDSKLMAAH